jgi:hypothetical protein
MQMGRWFGYRPGYLDLCRLFTTATLRTWYRHIALAESELRREFDYMVDAGLTPENYGLRVRTHPAGMIVTALNKMSHGRTLELSWAGVLSQTTQLPKEAFRIAANLQATEKFLGASGAPSAGTGRETRLWRGVGAERIAEYVESLQFPPAAARASGEQLAAFIRKQATKSPAELTAWTVALVSNAQGNAGDNSALAGLPIGLIERTPESQNRSSFSLTKANILNPIDESRDFTGEKFDDAWCSAVINKNDLEHDREWLRNQVGRSAMDVALDLTQRWQSTDPPKIRKPKDGTQQRRPNGRILRILRRQTQGLLLIYPLKPPTTVKIDKEQHEPTGLDPKGAPIMGVALSFPTSATTLGVEYRVNKVWGSEITEDEEYAD